MFYLRADTTCILISKDNHVCFYLRAGANQRMSTNQGNTVYKIVDC